MNKINRTCLANELESLINSTPDGGVCVLEAKEYYLTRQVVINNKKGITVDGSKATIVTKYVNNDDYSKSTNENILKFRDYLNEKGIVATIRRELGSDIDAACGQLRKKEVEKC